MKPIPRWLLVGVFMGSGLYGAFSALNPSLPMSNRVGGLIPVGSFGHSLSRFVLGVAGIFMIYFAFVTVQSRDE